MEIKIEKYVHSAVDDRLRKEGEIIIRPAIQLGYVEIDGYFVKADDLKRSLTVATEPVTNPY